MERFDLTEPAQQTFFFVNTIRLFHVLYLRSLTKIIPITLFLCKMLIVRCLFFSLNLEVGYIHPYLGGNFQVGCVR